MKVLQLFVHFTDEQYSQLMKEHKDEVMLKTFLGSEISKSVAREVERIKEEDFKANEFLSKEEKL